MNSEQLKHFSEELKKARETSNLTLQIMFQRTRIDLKFLEAIEECNFEVIDEVYLRAFIKSYAKTVGLNPEETLKKFDLAKSGHLFDKSADENEEDKSEDEKQEESETKKVVFTSENVAAPYYESGQKKKADPRLFIIGAALIIVLVVVYIFVFGSDAGKIIVESAEKPEVQKTEPVERFELVVEDSVQLPKEVVSGQDSIALKITANSRVWIRLIADEKDQSEFTLNPDESKTVTADSIFNLLIGNAGGINLELNGTPLNLIGKIGEIKNIRIDTTGIKYLRISQTKLDETN